MLKIIFPLLHCLFFANLTWAQTRDTVSNKSPKAHIVGVKKMFVVDIQQGNSTTKYTLQQGTALKSTTVDSLLELLVQQKRDMLDINTMELEEWLRGIKSNTTVPPYQFKGRIEEDRLHLISVGNSSQSFDLNVENQFQESATLIYKNSPVAKRYMDAYFKDSEPQVRNNYLSFPYIISFISGLMLSLSIIGALFLFNSRGKTGINKTKENRDIFEESKPNEPEEEKISNEPIKTKEDAIYTFNNQSPELSMDIKNHIDFSSKIIIDDIYLKYDDLKASIKSVEDILDSLSQEKSELVYMRQKLLEKDGQLADIKLKLEDASKKDIAEKESVMRENTEFLLKISSMCETFERDYPKGERNEMLDRLRTAWVIEYLFKIAIYSISHSKVKLGKDYDQYYKKNIDYLMGSKEYSPLSNIRQPGDYSEASAIPYQIFRIMKMNNVSFNEKINLFGYSIGW